MPATSASCTIDQLARDLQEVLRAVVPDGPIVLIGHSMGGMTIMALAERVLTAIERNRREVFVPRVYRIAPFAQVLVPGLVARAGKRGVRPAGD